MHAPDWRVLAAHWASGGLANCSAPINAQIKLIAVSSIAMRPYQPGIALMASLCDRRRTASGGTYNGPPDASGERRFCRRETPAL